MRLANQNGNFQLNVAIVGLGYWGPNLLRVLTDLDGVAVKTACDLDPERLRRLARRYPGLETTQVLADVLCDPAIDAIVIATPVHTHFSLAIQSLEAGKHTFVEKPLAPSTQEADQLIAFASSQDLALACGHTFIYSAPVKTVKEFLRQGELGELFFISSTRVNLGIHQQDVSVVWDLGPHDFSILLYWLNEMPMAVRTVGRDSIVKGVPDVAFTTLEFPSGLVASVEVSWLAPSKMRRTVIVGRDKMVVYDDTHQEPIRLFDHGVVYRDPETFGEYQLSYRTGAILSPKIDTYEPLACELADFIAAVRGEISLDNQTALARNVVRVTEAADQSLRSGGQQIDLGEARRNGSHRPSKLQVS